MDFPKYSFLEAPQTLDLLPPTSKTCAVPMIPRGSRCIDLPHTVLFLTLFKDKEAFQSPPYEVALEPPALLACLDSVTRHYRSSILLPLYNLAPKTHP